MDSRTIVGFLKYNYPTLILILGENIINSQLYGRKLFHLTQRVVLVSPFVHAFPFRNEIPGVRQKI